jgi:hypothetical protein
MLRLFAEASNGMMDNRFFSMIESGEISNAVEAQRYFEKKRIMKQKSLLIKVTKIQKEEIAKKESERLAKIEEIKWDHAKHPEVMREPLMDKARDNFLAKYWIK